MFVEVKFCWNFIVFCYGYLRVVEMGVGMCLLVKKSRGNLVCYRMCVLNVRCLCIFL